MAQKLNLDFSIGESIVNGINSTPDVTVGSVSINTTDVALVGAASALQNASNNTLNLANENVELVNRNYKNALNSFEALQVGSGFGVIGAGAKK